MSSLEAAILTARQAAEDAPTPAARAAWLAELAALRAEHARVGALVPACYERDRLAAMRPPGCWCLGLGGGGIPTLADDGETVYAWTRWCDCPEAQALRARVEADERAYEAQRAAEAAAEAARATAERLAAAGIPAALAHCTFASYPVPRPAILGALARFAEPAAWPRETAGGYTRRRTTAARRSVWLHGPPGRGKSGLAAAALRAWIEAGGAGRFVLVGTYLDQLRAAFGADDEAVVAARDALRWAGLLVLDDLGAERLTEWARGELWALLHHRLDAERLPTIVTSNLPPAAALERLAGGDRVMAERLTSRVAGACEVLALADGPDLRQPAARQEVA